jgi:hypothetical protein
VEQPAVSGRDGYKALELVMTMHLSLSRKARITLPLDAQSADTEVKAWLKSNGWVG